MANDNYYQPVYRTQMYSICCGYSSCKGPIQIYSVLPMHAAYSMDGETSCLAKDCLTLQIATTCMLCDIGRGCLLSHFLDSKITQLTAKYHLINFHKMTDHCTFFLWHKLSARQCIKHLTLKHFAKFAHDHKYNSEP